MTVSWRSHQLYLISDFSLFCSKIDVIRFLLLSLYAYFKLLIYFARVIGIVISTTFIIATTFIITITIIIGLTNQLMIFILSIFTMYFNVVEIEITMNNWVYITIQWLVANSLFIMASGFLQWSIHYSIWVELAWIFRLFLLYDFWLHVIFALSLRLTPSMGHFIDFRMQLMSVEILWSFHLLNYRIIE